MHLNMAILKRNNQNTENDGTAVQISTAEDKYNLRQPHYWQSSPNGHQVACS